MPDAMANFAISTVAAAPSPATSGTSLTVQTGHGARFPTPPFNASVWPTGVAPDPTNAEIVRVTGISTDTLTITRAQEGTSARSIGVGDVIAATVTAKTFSDITVGFGHLASGYYYYATALQSTSTSTLPQGSLRLAPWFVPNTVTLSKIGAEVTSGGDAGSKFRLGIYADNGNCYPGSLVLDAGQIAGDSATVQEIAVSVTLTSGLYWVGGASQSVTTTAPTFRVGQGIPLIQTLPMGTTIPSAGSAVVGYQQASVTGVLPATFSSTLTVGATIPKVFVKVA